MSGTQGAGVLHLDGGHGWAGGQNQVRLLVRELARRGYHQLVLCPRGSMLEKRLRTEGLPVEGITWPRGSDPRAALAIAKRMKPFGLLHCHDAHALQTAIVPAKLRRKTLIATRRSLFTTSALKWNRADAVIAVSDAVARLLESSGVHAGRIHTVHSAIDVDEVRALEPATPTLRERINVPADAFLVGNVATLVEYKRQAMLPRAAARMRDAFWVIIGEGPERAAIQSTSAAHGTGDIVRMPGNLPDARRYLHELDVFVFPSVGEALGTSVLDAMARGVPVVAADDAGPAEILAPVHAQTGASLFPPDDVDALVALLQRLRAEPALRTQLVSAQHERLEAFRIEPAADRIVDIYRRFEVNA